jgi:hypothetical protein
MTFENTFKRRLADEGIKSIPSHSDFPSIFEEDQENDNQHIKNLGCDSVLLSRVVDWRNIASFTTKSKAPTYLTRPPLGGNSLDYSQFPRDSLRISYYSSGINAIPRPPKDIRFIVLTIELLLYNLQSGDLIWAVRLETSFESNFQEMTQKIIDEAVKDIKVNGLI